MTLGPFQTPGFPLDGMKTRDASALLAGLISNLSVPKNEYLHAEFWGFTMEVTEASPPFQQFKCT